MTYTGEISGTGNSKTRVNEITADDVQTIRNYITNFENGVVSGLDENDRTETSFTINSGLCFAYSYYACFPDKFTFYFNKTADTQYHFIYAELNKSVIPNTAILKVKNNQASKEPKPTTFRQDVLSSVKTGIYQLPLYRITLTSDGISEVEDIRNIKKSIKRVVRANQAHKITQQLSSSVIATTQVESDNSEKIATTMFVHNAIRDYIDNK